MYVLRGEINWHSLRLQLKHCEFTSLCVQRLQFDVTSPNGVLLFREASKTITCYGEHILTHTDIPDDKLYALKYPIITEA